MAGDKINTKMIVEILKIVVVGAAIFAVLFYFTAYILKDDMIAFIVLIGFILYLSYMLFISPPKKKSKIYTDYVHK